MGGGGGGVLDGSMANPKLGTRSAKRTPLEKKWGAAHALGQNGKNWEGGHSEDQKCHESSAHKPKNSSPLVSTTAPPVKKWRGRRDKFTKGKIL